MFNFAISQVIHLTKLTQLQFKVMMGNKLTIVTSALCKEKVWKKSNIFGAFGEYICLGLYINRYIR